MGSRICCHNFSSITTYEYYVVKQITAFVYIILIGALLMIYYWFDPSEVELFPKCPFYMLTGLKCPGCGSQRAIHSLLHLDFIGAIRYNLLLVLFMPFISVLSYAEFMKTKHPDFYVRIHSVSIILSVLFIVILWWIVRNIIGY